MQISQDGIRLIKNFEAVSYRAKQNAAGTWVIGYRHTEGVGEGTIITPTEVEDFLTHDLAEIARRVDDWVSVPLTQHQFDALVAFCFDLGPDALRQSILLSLLNAGQYTSAADAFLEFEDTNLRRREAERQWFVTPDQQASWWEKFMTWIGP